MARTLIPRTNWLWPSFENELVNRFFSNREDWVPAHDGFSPSVNVAETQTDYEVSVELPGMKPEDFHVELEGNELRISGEKKEDVEEKGKTYHRVERTRGEFLRVIPLNTAVKADQITAEYKNGVLNVKVPKAEEAKPRKIEIKT